MQFDKGRDLVRAGEVLEAWLRHRLDLASATVSGVGLPDRAGLSNETILFDAVLDDGASTTTEHLVLRVSPSAEHQLFADTLFQTQARLLRVLRDEQQLRVPNVRWFEDDPRWFERPFFVMDRARGRVPISEPIYNAEGWLHDASPAQRRRAWESAMTELVRINRVPPDLVRFLPGGSGEAPGLHEALHGIRAQYAWACAGVEHPIVDRLWDWLESNLPAAPPIGLSWGDARIGNMMFDDDFEVVVVMDWELVSLGTPIMDLGWWLFFDDVHSQGHPRLQGLGDRQETIDLWEEGTGLSADGVEWFEILAAVRLAALTIRSLDLMGIKGDDWGTFPRLAYERLGWSAPTLEP